MKNININLYNQKNQSSVNIEKMIKAPIGKRVLGFFNGQYWIVNENECRGCLMQSRKNELPKYMDPIYEDEDVWVAQDAEFAVPGFYIVATKKHFANLAEITPNLGMKIGLITYFVRTGLKNVLKVKFAELYHEERMSNSHYHHWLLPCWDYAIKRCRCLPTIFPSKVKKYSHFKADIIKYLRSFNYYQEKDKILNYNDLMRKYFLSENIAKYIKKLNEKT